MSDPEPDAIIVRLDADIRNRRIEAIGRHIADDLAEARKKRTFWQPTHWVCVGFATLAPLAITALATAVPLPVLSVIGFIGSAAAIVTGSVRTAERVRKAEEAEIALLEMEREQQDLAILQQSTDPGMLMQVDRRYDMLGRKLSALREGGLVLPPEPPPPPRLTGPPD